MIYVIGDAIIDEYVYGDYKRISPEAPIPVFLEKNREKRSGGVLNVVNNLRALGADYYEDYSINSHKTRFVVDNRIVFRSDKEEYIPSLFTSNGAFEVDWLVMSDYNKGYLHESQRYVDYFREIGSRIIVDPKKHLSNYMNANIVKLNKKEFTDYTDFYDLSDCDKVRKKYNIESLVVTLGSNGVYIDSDEYCGYIRSKQHQVSDVTGAGDVFLASMSHFLDKGHTLKAACERANILAGISVTHMGTYVLTEEDISQTNVIFTNGCFDIIHKGHIDYLQKSKKLGGKLIVGLNSDASVRALKGSTRPINNQDNRKAVLESIDCVDEVIIFDEDTPYDLIKQVKPDIITKGSDYTPEQVVGNDLAKVVIIPLLHGCSTTKILERLKDESN